MKNNMIKIWKDKNAILEGIKNNVFRTAHVEEIAAARLDICGGCEMIDHIGKTCVVPGTSPCCGDCGCALSTKTRSLSSACPKDKWKAVLSTKEADALTEELEK